MDLADFTIRAKEAIKQIVLDSITNSFEKSIAGVSIEGLAYKSGDILQKWGVLDKDGNVDLGLIEAAVGNGVVWPFCVKIPYTSTTLKFEKSDWDMVMKAVRGNAR